LTARRDPEGRRRAIVLGAIRAIAEHGAGGVTHRRIAEHAGVPLGSTTYYFPTLDDLVAAAFAEAAEQAAAGIAGWGRELTESADLPATVVDLAEGYLADRDRALIEYELYVAATRTPGLAPVVRVWLDGLRQVFEPFTGPAAARALAALVDGAILQALVSGEPLDADAVRAGVRALTLEQR
jgi:TetR/AcrR family transcriptional regulator, regulator of biofilm formation and stress response